MRKRRKDALSIPTIEQVENARKRIEHKKKYKRALSSTVSVLVVVAAVAVLIATLFLPVLEISGTSMEPTLNDGDIVLLIKTDQYKPGHLCGLYWQNKLLLKRVIALPGSMVEIDAEGNVYVDGTYLEEPYVLNKALGECDIEFPYQVPDNKLFIMGDQRDTSIDSRSTIIGCVEIDQIVGRVLLRIWPLKEIAWMD